MGWIPPFGGQVPPTQIYLWGPWYFSSQLIFFKIFSSQEGPGPFRLRNFWDPANKFPRAMAVWKFGGVALLRSKVLVAPPGGKWSPTILALYELSQTPLERIRFLLPVWSYNTYNTLNFANSNPHSTKIWGLLDEMLTPFGSRVHVLQTMIF